MIPIKRHVNNVRNYGDIFLFFFEKRLSVIKLIRDKGNKQLAKRARPLLVPSELSSEVMELPLHVMRRIKILLQE
jgi:hypothetical protein